MMTAKFEPEEPEPEHAPVLGRRPVAVERPALNSPIFQNARRQRVRRAGEGFGVGRVGVIVGGGCRLTRTCINR